MKKTILLPVFSAALLVISSSGFSQQGHFAQHHPRRAEVNHRAENQNDRIHDKVKDGQMSKKEAAKLHKEDHQVRQEQRDMAVQNHGHITKQEQKTLNQQENHINKQIKNH